jgi:integrase
MKPTSSRKTAQEDSWPRKVQPGREIVTVYRRQTPSGNYAYMIANYVDGKRRFDSYATETGALEAAEALAKRIDKRDYLAASMTKDQAAEWASSVERLKPFGVSVDDATTTVARCLKIVPDLASIEAGLKYYATRYRQVIKISVVDVVAEMLKVKKNEGVSDRYLKDLAGRLTRFADDCKKNSCDVTTPDVRAWLDGLGTVENPLGKQSRKNYKTVVGTLFQFAVERGYASYNPVEAIGDIRVRSGDVQIYTPVEIARLLEAAKEHYPDYVPVLAIGAFAGLRSAEIERLTWQDIDLKDRYITMDASKTKTASRRVVPISENLAAWLADYSKETGKVWKNGSVLFYKRQYSVASQTEVHADEKKGIKAEKPVEWKANGLRHSYASYRLAAIQDAGRVAGECGNTAKVIYKHYHKLTKPADAERWFNVKPESPANVLSLALAASK